MWKIHTIINYCRTRRKTTGEIYIEGEKVNGISSKIGYMLQRDCLLEWRNILSNTMFGLEVKGKRIM